MTTIKQDKQEKVRQTAAEVKETGRHISESNRQGQRRREAKDTIACTEKTNKARIEEKRSAKAELTDTDYKIYKVGIEMKQGDKDSKKW